MNNNLSVVKFFRVSLDICDPIENNPNKRKTWLNFLISVLLKGKSVKEPKIIATIKKITKVKKIPSALTYYEVLSPG